MSIISVGGNYGVNPSISEEKTSSANLNWFSTAKMVGTAAGYGLGALNAGVATGIIYSTFAASITVVGATGVAVTLPASLPCMTVAYLAGIAGSALTAKLAQLAVETIVDDEKAEKLSKVAEELIKQAIYS